MSDLATIAERFVKDADVRATYARDESLGVEAPERFEVVRARDLSDVVDVLTYAAGTGTPVVPQGARSGLAGGAVVRRGRVPVGHVDEQAVLGHGVLLDRRPADSGCDHSTNGGSPNSTTRSPCSQSWRESPRPE